jgi:hypothetical protein
MPYHRLGLLDLWLGENFVLMLGIRTVVGEVNERNSQPEERLITGECGNGLPVRESPNNVRKCRYSYDSTVAAHRNKPFKN